MYDEIMFGVVLETKNLNTTETSFDIHMAENIT